jgi:hypothetical protein
LICVLIRRYEICNKTRDMHKRLAVSNQMTVHHDFIAHACSWCREIILVVSSWQRHWEKRQMARVGVDENVCT